MAPTYRVIFEDVSLSSEQREAAVRRFRQSLEQTFGSSAEVRAALEASQGAQPSSDAKDLWARGMETARLFALDVDKYVLLSEFHVTVV